MGLWKAFDYDAPDTTPVFYGGESRAENVAVSEYCVYLDVFYADGSVTWGERADFAQGTHDWQKVCGALVPKKPVKRVEVYALCRKGSEKGRVEFRDFFLERREGRGERLYETRRSRRPYADEDEIFYSEFRGREKLYRYETVPALAAERPGLKGRESAVWTADSMRLVLPSDMPTAADLAAKRRIRFDLAKRGTGSGQILVSTSADTELENVTIEIPTLRTRDGKPLKGSVAWRRVGYIPRGGMLFYHEHRELGLVPAIV